MGRGGAVNQGTVTASMVMAATLLASAAQAQSPEVERLMRRNQVLDGICRGSSGAASDQACCERTKVGVRLNRLGWCYGKHEQIGADMRWHRCTSTSQRHNLSDYC
jgi:hypothetical protein